MAVHTGTTGAITVIPAAGSDFVAALHPNRWSLDMGMETVEATAFSPTSNARTRLPGLSAHSGSAEGLLDSTSTWNETDTFNTPLLCGFLLTATTGQTYTFSGWITGFSPSVGVGETATWTCTFDVTGAVEVKYTAPA